MGNLNRYLGLILACTLALFLSASGGPVMAQAEGNQEDGSWVPENWAQEDEDIDKGTVPEKGGYQKIEDPLGADGCGCKVDGQYLVVLFNIDMDQGQSFGGSVFEYRRQTQIVNSSPVDNSSLIDNFGNLSIRKQVGNINISTLGQFGP